MSMAFAVHAQEQSSGAHPSPFRSSIRCGGADPDAIDRTIEVQIADRDDMSAVLAPASINMTQNASNRLAIRNTGSIPHEFVMAAPDDIAQHCFAMTETPDMDHRAPYERRLDPDETGKINWTFSNIGVFAFACLIPGTCETGMIGVLTVEEPKTDTKRKETQ